VKFERNRLIPDVVLIKPERVEDLRGSFAGVFCEKEFKDQDLESNFVRASLSSNIKKGTFRGLHIQMYPYQEVKLVRCISGKIFDIALDLRVDSTTYCKWIGVELDAEKDEALYIPKGFAHGFIYLEDNTKIYYMISQFYNSQFEMGIKYDDPTFQIILPLKPTILSDKDKTWPIFGNGWLL
jgi:dTDP-4-dehydrorhamnose 3,5-epimerase